MLENATRATKKHGEERGQLRASVVIPAYNAAKTIAATLEALDRQTYPRDLFEVIVVDDGSRDETAAIATTAGVRVLRQANYGAATARNHGAHSARGQILVFTDADCVPTPTWLDRMLAPFDDPVVDGVKGAYRTHQRSIVARFAQVEFEDRYELQRRGPTIDMVDSYSAAFRRDLFIHAGGYNERFLRAENEDTELSYRLAEAGAYLVFAPDALVYHAHATTLWRYMRLKFRRGYWRLHVYRMYTGKAVKDSYTPQVLKIQSALAGGLLALLPSAIFWRPSRIVVALFAAALFASTLPFTRFVAQRDAVVALCTPLIVSLRAVAIGAGTAVALLGLGHGLDYSRDPQGTLRSVSSAADSAPTDSREGE